jgi:hypothetical protein
MPSIRTSGELRCFWSASQGALASTFSSKTVLSRRSRISSGRRPRMLCRTKDLGVVSGYKTLAGRDRKNSQRSLSASGVRTVTPSDAAQASIASVVVVVPRVAWSVGRVHRWLTGSLKTFKYRGKPITDGSVHGGNTEDRRRLAAAKAAARGAGVNSQASCLARLRRVLPASRRTASCFRSAPHLRWLAR